MRAPSRAAFTPRALDAVQVEVQVSLVHPVNEPPHRYPGMQDHVDEVRGGQALHVLDALLEEAGFVPHAQAVDLVERVGGLSDGTTTRSAVAANRCMACIPTSGKKPPRRR